MTPITKREPPVGYQEEWDSTTWNMGFVFRWSEFYEAWLDCGIVLTVKPGQTLAEAFEVRMDEPMWKQYSIFFNVDKS